MIQLVKGTKDIYGAEVKAWQEIEGKMRRLCETFGIGEIRTPAFELRSCLSAVWAKRRISCRKKCIHLQMTVTGA